MVRYYSDDGVLDAPVPKVWQLIQAHQQHGAEIHPGIVSAKPMPNAPDGAAMLEVVTKGPDGQPQRHVWKMAMRPPHAQTVDFVEGPMKGSWMSTTYVPEGNRTRLVTVAEWKVQGVTDDKALMKIANDFFDNGFEEDARWLKTMK